MVFCLKGYFSHYIVCHVSHMVNYLFVFLLKDIKEGVHLFVPSQLLVLVGRYLKSIMEGPVTKYVSFLVLLYFQIENSKAPPPKQRKLQCRNKKKLLIIPEENVENRPEPCTISQGKLLCSFL